MGGFFGVTSKDDCVMDLFFGTDYHSHLGTRRGGMAVYGPRGFQRSIHNIENSPFRTKFERDVEELEGRSGIGSISDNEPQPLLIQSHLGSFAIVTVGKINNEEELVHQAYENGHIHFMEMSGGRINATELTASIINQKQSLVEGLLYAQEMIKGSMTILILTPEGIYASRDRYGRTPVMIGRKENAFCVSFESFAYINLGYHDYSELGPGEIVLVSPDGIQSLSKPRKEMKICSFLWVYYGYPTSSYEGVNVEDMRYRCGRILAQRDMGCRGCSGCSSSENTIHPDVVAGVPDSGTAHAIGYANESGIPFARPFIKYTPTWPRSFMPQNQSQRNLIAKMKLIPVNALIQGKSLLLIDDSIVRGTQLGETTEFLYESGAKEVHIRPACPPLLFGCKYLNFSRSNSELDLITRRIIREREGDEVSEEILADYADPDSQNYHEMIEEIRKRLNFTSLKYHRLDDLVESIGISPDKLCTYCWSGKE
ncbi:MAG TPA: amidophosphoribosyltransferase [Candidatus Caccovicinus merdipullorum]|uniref:Amidophosphoribosyltransferase n=1 Tax=Candidatus Caccovicinus merdipullorum TaxID=2840724 RepID=A0A9D1GKX7_9FIRM|nr:amidophosphoribosyltransferase [Candidatus Caccovicinus merdipullorum]